MWSASTFFEPVQSSPTGGSELGLAEGRPTRCTVPSTDSSTASYGPPQRRTVHIIAEMELSPENPSGETSHFNQIGPELGLELTDELDTATSSTLRY